MASSTNYLAVELATGNAEQTGDRPRHLVPTSSPGFLAGSANTAAPSSVSSGSACPAGGGAAAAPSSRTTSPHHHQQHQTQKQSGANRVHDDDFDEESLYRVLYGRRVPGQRRRRVVVDTATMRPLMENNNTDHKNNSYQNRSTISILSSGGSGIAPLPHVNDQQKTASFSVENHSDSGGAERRDQNQNQQQQQEQQCSMHSFYEPVYVVPDATTAEGRRSYGQLLAVSNYRRSGTFSQARSVVDGLQSKLARVRGLPRALPGVGRSGAGGALRSPLDDVEPLVVSAVAAASTATAIFNSTKSASTRRQQNSHHQRQQQQPRQRAASAASSTTTSPLLRLRRRIENEAVISQVIRAVVAARASSAPGPFLSSSANRNNSNKISTTVGGGGGAQSITSQSFATCDDVGAAHFLNHHHRHDQSTRRGEGADEQQRVGGGDLDGEPSSSVFGVSAGLDASATRNGGNAAVADDSTRGSNDCRNQHHHHHHRHQLQLQQQQQQQEQQEGNKFGRSKKQRRGRFSFHVVLGRSCYFPAHVGDADDNNDNNEQEPGHANDQKNQNQQHLQQWRQQANGNSNSSGKVLRSSCLMHRQSGRTSIFSSIPHHSHGSSWNSSVLHHLHHPSSRNNRSRPHQHSQQQQTDASGGMTLTTDTTTTMTASLLPVPSPGPPAPTRVSDHLAEFHSAAQNMNRNDDMSDSNQQDNIENQERDTRINHHNYNDDDHPHHPHQHDHHHLHDTLFRSYSGSALDRFSLQSQLLHDEEMRSVYVRHQLLGQGAFAETWLCEWVPDSRTTSAIQNQQFHELRAVGASGLEPRAAGAGGAADAAAAAAANNHSANASDASVGGGTGGSELVSSVVVSRHATTASSSSQNYLSQQNQNKILASQDFLRGSISLHAAMFWSKERHRRLVSQRSAPPLDVRHVQQFALSDNTATSVDASAPKQSDSNNNNNNNVQNNNNNNNTASGRDKNRHDSSPSRRAAGSGPSSISHLPPTAFSVTRVDGDQFLSPLASSPSHPVPKQQTNRQQAQDDDEEEEEEEEENENEAKNNQPAAGGGAASRAPPPPRVAVNVAVVEEEEEATNNGNNNIKNEIKANIDSESEQQQIELYKRPPAGYSVAAVSDPVVSLRTGLRIPAHRVFVCKVQKRRSKDKEAEKRQRIEKLKKRQLLAEQRLRHQREARLRRLRARGEQLVDDGEESLGEDEAEVGDESQNTNYNFEDDDRQQEQQEQQEQQNDSDLLDSTTYLLDFADNDTRRPDAVSSWMNNGPDEASARESSILSKLAHPCIIGFIESFTLADGAECLVMEYCDGGDLRQEIRRRLPDRTIGRPSRHLNENLISFLFVQICMGVEYLHRHSILHRDLKTSNILISKKWFVKIADFGLANRFATDVDDPRAPASAAIGTPYYLSPEALRRQPYGDKADAWSLGVILFELMTLRRPFEAPDVSALAKKIVHSPFVAPSLSSLSYLIPSALRAGVAAGLGGGGGGVNTSSSPTHSNNNNNDNDNNKGLGLAGAVRSVSPESTQTDAPLSKQTAATKLHSSCYEQNQNQQQQQQEEEEDEQDADEDNQNNNNDDAERAARLDLEKRRREQQQREAEAAAAARARYNESAQNVADLVDIVKQLLEKDPAKRPSVKQVLQTRVMRNAMQKFIDRFFAATAARSDGGAGGTQLDDLWRRTLLEHRDSIVEEADEHVSSPKSRFRDQKRRELLREMQSENDKTMKRHVHAMQQQQHLQQYRNQPISPMSPVLSSFSSFSNFFSNPRQLSQFVLDCRSFSINDDNNISNNNGDDNSSNNDAAAAAVAVVSSIASSHRHHHPASTTNENSNFIMNRQQPSVCSPVGPPFSGGVVGEDEIHHGDNNGIGLHNQQQQQQQQQQPQRQLQQYQRPRKTPSVGILPSTPLEVFRARSSKNLFSAVVGEPRGGGASRK